MYANIRTLNTSSEKTPVVLTIGACDDPPHWVFVFNAIVELAKTISGSIELSHEVGLDPILAFTSALTILKAVESPVKGDFIHTRDEQLQQCLRLDCTS